MGNIFAGISTHIIPKNHAAHLATRLRSKRPGPCQNLKRNPVFKIVTIVPKHPDIFVG